jgi:hypothetical protein
LCGGLDCQMQSVEDPRIDERRRPIDSPGGRRLGRSPTYLIQDMRLPMAGGVDITNKQVLEEPHKRAAIATAGLQHDR